MSDEPSKAKEGQLYQVYRLGGKVFEIRYGYYSEAERLSESRPGDNLLPLFPDFIENPEYTDNGYPFAVDIQDPCEQYTPEHSEPEGWCRDCKYYPIDKPRLGICKCELRRIITAGKKERIV